MSVISPTRQARTEAIVPARPRWDYARNSAKKLNAVYSTPPIPVHEIAEQNGVDVVFTTFGSLADKISGLCDFTAKRIYVNEGDDLRRQMFTMAHELGHWMLHRDFVEQDPARYSVLPRFSDTSSNVLEQEANAFAAELLVPKALLDKVRGAPVSKLADLFMVTRTMMEYRLKSQW
jgi:Zn-dependent peptidase ImmA (M78 family)